MDQNSIQLMLMGLMCAAVLMAVAIAVLSLMLVRKAGHSLLGPLWGPVLRVLGIGTTIDDRELEDSLRALPQHDPERPKAFARTSAAFKADDVFEKAVERHSAKPAATDTAASAGATASAAVAAQVDDTAGAVPSGYIPEHPPELAPSPTASATPELAPSAAGAVPSGYIPEHPPELTPSAAMPEHLPERAPSPTSPATDSVPTPPAIADAPPAQGPYIAQDVTGDGIADNGTPHAPPPLEQRVSGWDQPENT
jgi:hypothetical protein